MGRIATSKPPCAISRTERDPERARCTERLGERDLLGRERSGLVPRAERESREGRVGAPRRGGRARASQPDEELAGGEEIVERRGWPELCQAKPAAGREQPCSVQHRRELLGEAVALIGRFGGLELSPLGERLEQDGECERSVDAG